MIVHSMSSKELTREIFSDYESVLRKVTHLIKGLRREVVKSKSKHVHRVFDYKTNKYNNWKIIVDYPYKHPTHMAMVYYTDGQGLHGIRVDGNLRSLTHLTPHFLSRYNERLVKLTSVSKIELLVRFLEGNFLDAVKYINTENASRSEILCKFRDGVGFGDSEYFPELRKEILHFRTFITNEMLFDDQLEDVIQMDKGIRMYMQEHRSDFPMRA
jgi:hypothetical protein